LEYCIAIKSLPKPSYSREIKGAAEDEGRRVARGSKDHTKGCHRIKADEAMLNTLATLPREASTSGGVKYYRATRDSIALRTTNYSDSQNLATRGGRQVRETERKIRDGVKTTAFPEAAAKRNNKKGRRGRRLGILQHCGGRLEQIESSQRGRNYREAR